MSRKIKFRAWVNGHWTDFIPVAKTLGEYNESLIDTGSCTYEKDNPFIVEQYTGLKDKNGKEIYEGDIVREDIEVGDDDIDGEYRYQVVWDEETLCWSLSPNYGAIHKDLWETNLSREVIGNIHENKELLNGSN